MAVKNNLSLIFSYFKLNIKKEWQYKTSFFMQIIMMILNDAFFLIQWFIIFTLVDDIGGYGFKETMALWSITAGGFGFARSFFGGAWNIKSMVYDGKLDVFLAQPKNILINVCCSSTEISAIGDIFYSFIVLIIIGAPWWWFFALIPLIILTGLIYVSIYVCYVSLSFYIKNGDAIAHSVESTILKAANYPPSIFSGIVKWIFFTIIPTFFFSFIPVQYMFLTPNPLWILLLIGVVIFWICMAFILFNKGLKKYNSGSLMGGRV